MNKSEFLNELEKNIRVLEKNEINDILNEYSQHIDMRMKNGLSESEAIKDFGSLDELTAEILEAYHVNPEYEKTREATSGITKTAGELFEKVKKSKVPSGVIDSSATWIKKIFNYIGEGFKKLSVVIKEFFVRVAEIFRWEEESKKPFESDSASASKNDTLLHKSQRNKINISKQMSYGRGVLKKLLFSCLVIFVVLCLIPVGFVSIFSVFSVGVTLVFLIQGYPVIGILIALLGLSLCSVAVGGLLLSLIVKPKKIIDKTQEVLPSEGIVIDEANGEAEGE